MIARFLGHLALGLAAMVVVGISCGNHCGQLVWPCWPLKHVNVIAI